jgi:ketosteroid isomerase-like protein
MTAEQLVALHLQRFGKGDIDGLMSEYAADVVFITRDKVLRGPAEVRPLLEAMLAEFSQPGVRFELLARRSEGDYAYITWTAETPQHHYALGSDTFVVRNGQIVMQSSATAVTAKPR